MFIILISLFLSVGFIVTVSELLKRGELLGAFSYELVRERLTWEPIASASAN